MRVLAIAPKIPWPLDQGDRVRMFNILKEVSKRHTITFIGCYLSNYQPLSEARRQLETLCAEVVFFKIPNHRLAMRVFLKIQATINLIFFSIRWPEYIYNLRPFIKLVGRYVEGSQYDIILTQYWYTAFIPIMNSKIASICDTIDVIWEGNYRSIQKYRNNKIRYWFLRRINERLRCKEAEVLNSYDLVITVHSKDANTLMNELKVSTRSVVLSHINSNRFDYRFNDSKENRILFFGGMNNEMNRDAVRYLANELFPEIRKQLPSTKLIIAGSSMDRAIELLEKNEAVTVLGYVSDIQLLFQNAKLLVIPLRYGAGLKGRVLEAMEAGLPVVGSTIAAEGIPVVNGVHMVIEDNKERIVEGVVTLLKDDEKRKAIALNARRYFDENYSWEKTYGKINDLIAQVFAKQSSKIVTE